MKHLYLKVMMLTMFMSMVGMKAMAYDAEIDGIYYDFSGTEATVTYKTTYYNSYSGSVVIPSTITYNGTTYNVTYIGYKAFWGCSGLTSITIPNGVTTIGEYNQEIKGETNAVAIPVNG